MLFNSKIWFCLAMPEGNPSIVVLEVKSFESKHHFVGVCKGEGAGVGHVVSPCIVVCGGQFQFELQSYKESSVMVFSKV